MNRIFFLVVAVIAAGAVPAQEPRPGCTTSEYRQFDFWLGRFEVRSAEDRLAGHNVIESTLGGCALTEHWTGVGGIEGRSINFFDRHDGRWHQVWIDDSGEPLYLSGGLEGESMVLAGESVGTGGEIVTQRITWVPLGDGRVRQHWETSTDGGGQWQTVFDGYYARKP